MRLKMSPKTSRHAKAMLLITMLVAAEAQQVRQAIGKLAEKEGMADGLIQDSTEKLVNNLIARCAERSTSHPCGVSPSQRNRLDSAAVGKSGNINPHALSRGQARLHPFPRLQILPHSRAVQSMLGESVVPSFTAPAGFKVAPVVMARRMQQRPRAGSGSGLAFNKVFLHDADLDTTVLGKHASLTGSAMARSDVSASASKTIATSLQGNRSANLEWWLNAFKESKGDTNVSVSMPTVKGLLKLFAPEWPLIAVALVLLIISAVCQAMVPAFTAETVNAIIKGQAAGGLSRADFQWPAVKFLLAAVFGAVCASFRAGIFTIVGGRTSVRLRTKLFKALLAQDIGFFDTTKSGEFTSRLISDCSTAVHNIRMNLATFLDSVIQIFTMFFPMAYFSWQGTVLSFTTVPLFAFACKICGNLLWKIFRDIQTKLADATAVALPPLSSMKTVRSFAAEREEADRFAGELQALFSLEVKRAKIWLAYTLSTQMLPEFCTFLVIFQIAYLCMHGLPAANLLAFVLYVKKLDQNFNGLAGVYTNLLSALGAVSRVFELINRQPEGRFRLDMSDSESLRERPSIVGHVQLKDVTFSYPARPNQTALRGLSLDCPPGKVTALVGPSGSGKSTCVALLRRLYEPKQGSVTLDGQDVEDYDHRAYHQMVSVVEQEPVLFGGSVRDNILYGLPKDHPARADTSASVENAARLANAHDFIHALPNGYQTTIGERGTQLSGGQKQRVAIARALVRKPTVLLLDEATSALDAASEAQVQGAISNLIDQRDLTVIVIAHRLSTVIGADKICVIENGTVAEEGTHMELLRKAGGRYKELVQQQLAHK